MPEEHLDWKTRRPPQPAAWFVDEDYVFQKHANFMKTLIEKGGRAAVGSHGQFQGLGYHWELWSMGSGGMTTHDALRTATIYGAEAIGMATDIGTIEAGKFADILVLDRDPLTDLRNTTSLRYVVKNGRVYNAETLDEVWPRERKLPAQYWQDVGLGGVRAGIR